MVATEPDIEMEDKPTIGITMFGVTTPCAQEARAYLRSWFTAFAALHNATL